VGGKAFTRAVSPKLPECALTHLDRVAIDVAKAAEQHGHYESALRGAGFEIVRLPDLPDDPDGVFVEDTALLLDGHAVITRPGAVSRADEVHSTASGLAQHFELHRIEQGHVDGGDVLRIGKTLHVGLSSRTNAEGIANLAQIAAGFGFGVEPADLRGCLHLKTAATVAGRDPAGRLILLYNADALDPAQFSGVEPVAVPAEEPDAANVLWAGEKTIVPAGHPATASLLRERGLEVVEIDVSELRKAEAGVTCMSLISHPIGDR